MKIFINLNVALLILADLFMVILFAVYGKQCWWGFFITNLILGPLQFLPGFILSVLSNFKSKSLNQYLVFSFILIGLTSISSGAFLSEFEPISLTICMLTSLVLANFYPLILKRHQKEKSLWNQIN